MNVLQLLLALAFCTLAFIVMIVALIFFLIALLVGLSRSPRDDVNEEES